MAEVIIRANALPLSVISKQGNNLASLRVVWEGKDGAGHCLCTFITVLREKDPLHSSSRDPDFALNVAEVPALSAHLNVRTMSTRLLVLNPSRLGGIPYRLQNLANTSA